MANIAAASRAGDPEAQFQAARAALVAHGDGVVQRLLRQAGLADRWAAADAVERVAQGPFQLTAKFELADFQIQNAAALRERQPRQPEPGEAMPELYYAVQTMETLQEDAKLLDSRIPRPGAADGGEAWRPSALVVAYAWARMGHMYCTRLFRSFGMELMQRALWILPSGPTPEVNEQAGWCT